MVYQNLQHMIEEHLRSITLEDLVIMISSYDHSKTVMNRAPITKDTLNALITSLAEHKLPSAAPDLPMK